MSRSILNYTTSIAAEKTVAQISDILRKANAQAVLTEYKDSQVEAISFRIKTQWGVLSYRLPANVEGVLSALQKDKAIPYRLRSKEHANNVAWRIIKDWLKAQLALIRAQLVTIDQVFLPFAQDATGRTVYERLKEERFSSLALPEK